MSGTNLRAMGISCLCITLLAACGSGSSTADDTAATPATSTSGATTDVSAGSTTVVTVPATTPTASTPSTGTSGAATGTSSTGTSGVSTGTTTSGGGSTATTPVASAPTDAQLAADPAYASFGLTESATYYTVDTGAGLVFKIRRVDNGVSTQSVGDIASMLYNGVEYQDASRGSQINGGFDYLYTDTSAVTVSATQVDSVHIKIAVTAGDLTHYYLAKRGDPRIYMATIFSREPNQTSESFIRYIVRVPTSKLSNGPAPSNLVGTNGTVESGDIFGTPGGETRSKHYSNQRLKDWSYIGATGANVGLWMVRGNTEGMSGGPFYRSLLNQGTSTDQEITYIVNYGMQQTEAYRTNILSTYTMVFTTGAAPAAVDNAWLSTMGLQGWVDKAARGAVNASAITGRDAAYTYTVGFANAAAQYYATASSSDGSFVCPDMLPGTYTMNVYKNELVVASQPVTVVATGSTSLGTITIANDPSSAMALWRIGDWDGTPVELLNGDKVTTMHPSDVRMASWTPGAYVIGSSTAKTGYPAYQWKEINGTQEIDFSLSASQVRAYTLRIGITAAYAGGRPSIQVNSWSAPLSAASDQPGSRSLTVGSYRGNNKMYTFSIPASALVAGNNVIKVGVISGSSGPTWLSPGYSTDAVDLIP